LILGGPPGLPGRAIGKVRIMNRILHIEDEPDIQVVARIALEDVGGFVVSTASSGVEGLAMAEGLAPDLILLDVMMPGMDGPATLAALRAHPATASIPVIFMTAKVQSHEISRYKALGALGVINKPFDPMTLAAEVRAMWAPQGGPLAAKQ
jgi:two-component system OmpR family response regulator